MMKRIATITVNPSIDESTRVGRVVPDEKLRCAQPRREPGGGGINVSRALQRLGGASTVIYTVGGPTGEILKQLLNQEGLAQQTLPIRGWTRQNLTVFEETSEHQFRFGMPGPEIEREEWQRCLDAVSALDPAPDYVVASGSLAPGMPQDFYGQLARRVRELGARFVLDSSGAALRHGAEAGVYLLKPNAREFQNLTGEAIEDEQQMEMVGRRLLEDCQCGVIVVSLGSGGAHVITSERSQHVRAPTVPIRSKVGAGDSMVGGIVLGLVREMDLIEAVRFGVAAGAAAVMTEGTELCRREDAERLYAQMPRGGN